MANHLTEDEIDRLAQGDATPAALSHADAHLGSCADCRDRLAHTVSSGRDLLDAVAIEARAHLTFEQLESGIDGGALDPLARRHLESCDSCRRELEDLREFDRLKPLARTATAASRVAKRADGARTTAQPWWRVPVWSVAGAAALVVLAIGLWQFVPSTAKPIALSVRLTDPAAAMLPPSTVGPKSETGLSNQVLLAIGRARAEAERTRQPQTIEVQIERRRYVALLQYLRTEGVLEQTTPSQLPEGEPASILRVELTLVPSR